LINEQKREEATFEELALIKSVIYSKKNLILGGIKLMRSNRLILFIVAILSLMDVLPIGLTCAGELPR